MPFNGPDGSIGSQAAFFNIKRKVTEEIARLERLILACGVEMGERHMEREEFITKRQNDLKLLWEKRNSINEREKKLHRAPGSKQDKEPLFKQLDSERTYNDKKIEPRIQHWDEQIGIIEGRLLELQAQLRIAHLELEQQREILARFIPLVEGVRNQRDQSVPSYSATPAA